MFVPFIRSSFSYAKRVGQDPAAISPPAILVNVGDCSPTLAKFQSRKRGKQIETHSVSGWNMLNHRGPPSRTVVRLLASCEKPI
jgi:hypothetical protein